MSESPERAAFSRLYEAQAERMLIFFARRVYDVQTALDLTAETFAEAFTGRHRFRGSTEHEAQAWLYGIARHVLSRYFKRGRAERRALRRLGVSTPTVTEEDCARIEELAGLGELRSAVAVALQKLSTEHRQALQLRVVQELPYADVADRLNVSEQTARMRVSRALRALAGALDVISVAKGGTG